MTNEELFATAVTDEPDAARAVGARPPFQLPFPRGERWLAQTRADHKPNPHSLDLFREGGGSNGRTILASASGQVVKARHELHAGWMVRIDHGGGWQTRYLHMIEEPAVKEGQRVTQGQRIGRVGSTGDSGAPHLLYEQIAGENTVRSVLNGEPVQVRVGHGQILTSHAPAGPSGDGTLQLGSRGPAVRTLQESLNKVMRAGLAVDGEFGPATEAAVKAFQRKRGLDPDGLYGPATAAALRAALAGH
ncbi:peptidoglycan DD-metalloendopeptidase family protein [Actinoplanes sp. NPDC048796]|uniref:peptidoglycan DD-metalloendopeptidase family protein n=1 Tax=Actinoplanes sp. NPDC048796 TaxID=3155640 RepID=UPI0033FA41BA